MASSVESNKKTPFGFTKGVKSRIFWKSAQADLGQDALAGQEFSAEADHEAHHGEAAVPGFSEIDEAEACIVGH